MKHTIFSTDDSKATILIRLMISSVFLSEGIQKFLFPKSLGAGRFEKIGLPVPEFLGSLVGSLEIVCGILILLGLITRLASIPLLLIMVVAITATKTKILTDKGFWPMLHESRTDWAMFLGLSFLLFKGAGFWSLDYKYFRNGK